MSKRLVISMTALLIVGIAIGIISAMLFQAMHPVVAPTTVPAHHSHW